MKHNRRRSPGKPRVSPIVLDRINPNVADLDCGAAEHFVAVPPDRDATPVQSFQTFTGDLFRLAEWLTACRVQSVAMEATGVYWIPIYEILEARGFEPTQRTGGPLGSSRARSQRNPGGLSGGRGRPTSRIRKGQPGHRLRPRASRGASPLAPASDGSRSEAVQKPHAAFDTDTDAYSIGLR
jgi:hypothetical protein